MIIPFKGASPRIHPTAFIAESAEVIGDVTIGEDSGVWFQSVLRGDVNFIRIGARTNIQDGSVLHVRRDVYPLIIGDDVTVGHRAVLHGCVVGDRALVGIGAIVLDGAVVGEDSIIGAGSLVPPRFKVPPRTIVMGVPAQIRRELSPKEIAGIKESALNYVGYMKLYKNS
ncbi:MAG: gamma carbonic anhydrase family protein [Deltaproteobacteria bacterium]